MSHVLAQVRRAKRKPPVTESPPLPGPETFLERLDATNGAAGPAYHWRFADAAGATMAARIGGVAGTWVNTGDLDFQLDPLVTNPDAGKSIGFGADISAPGHGTIPIGGAGLSLGAQRTEHVHLQLDKVVPKHFVMTTGQAGQLPGQFSREIVEDGAGGMKPRMWTVNPSGGFVIYVGSQPGTVPIGEAFSIDFIQQNGTPGSLRCLVNGSEIALSVTGTPPNTWSAAPTGTLYVGTFNPIASPLDGVAADLAIYNTVLSLADAVSLAVPASIVWMGNFDAGSIVVNNVANIPVASHVHPGVAFTVSIVSQGTRGTATVAGESINYAAGATVGTNDTFTARITKGGVQSRTATITIDVTAAAPPATADLPWLGLYYGDALVGNMNGQVRMRASDDLGNSAFFYADRTGKITLIMFEIRWHNPGGGAATSYSSGDGGTYDIEIRPASASTKRPIPGSAYLSRLTGYKPGNPVANTDKFVRLAFTSTPGQVVAKQPYCVVLRNTGASPNNNWISVNIGSHVQWASSSDPTITEPGAGGATSAIVVASGGIDPGAVGSSIAPIKGYHPIRIDGKNWYPWPTNWNVSGSFAGLSYGRMGGLLMTWQYADGQWCGWDTGMAEPASWWVALTGSTQARMRFRVTRATRVVSGVFIHGWRRTSGGNLIVRLESGVASDSHNPGNGTLIGSEVTVPASHFLLCGTGWHGGWDSVQVQTGVLDLPHYVWVPFGANRTLTLGQTYTLRLMPSGCDIGTFAHARMDQHDPASQSGRSMATWNLWEATREVSWTAFEDSRGGAEVSGNGGASWAYAPGRIFPFCFKCVP